MWLIFCPRTLLELGQYHYVHTYYFPASFNRRIEGYPDQYCVRPSFCLYICVRKIGSNLWREKERAIREEILIRILAHRDGLDLTSDSNYSREEEHVGASAYHVLPKYAQVS